MQIGAGVVYESAKEIRKKLGLQITHVAHAQAVAVNQRRTAAEVQRNHREGFVHRHHKIARPIDSAAIAQRLRKQLAENDSAVFDRVMLVHVEITAGVQREVETSVPGEELQHMIEKPHAGVKVVSPAAIDRELPADRGLFRIAHDG